MFSSKPLEEYLMVYVKKIIMDGIKMTEHGSITYLLYGSTPSRQSICIKLGKLGEHMIKKIILETPHLELLTCGVQCVDQVTKKNKDIDLFWKDEKTKHIYYFEAKGNMELDTEKIKATIEKVLEIKQTYIEPKYPDYKVFVGIFHWSIYKRQKELLQFKLCEEKGIKVFHMAEMLQLLEFEWSETDFYAFFKQIGIDIDKMFNYNF